MKLSYLPVIAALALTTQAILPQQKAVIVSYSDSTPDSIVDQAISAIKGAGGVITHKYQTIKGFAAQAPEKALDFIKTLDAQYLPFIEEDQVVEVSGHDY